MKVHAVILTGLLLLAGAQVASAQAWDSPSFMPPQQSGSLGLYAVDPRGSDWGVMALWRRAGPATTLGLRGGIFEFDDARVAVGADIGRRLVRANADLPVDLTGTLGIGATFGDGTFARIPVGLSIGRWFAAQNWAFVPYVHPRIGLDLAANDDRTDADLRFTTDLGADFYISRRLLVRFGVAVGDHRAVGFGAALTSWPPVAVATR